MIQRIIEFLSLFIAGAIVISFHEFAHAFAAVKNGDNTPKAYNRYTLNPVAHFDLLGILCFVFARFGWAKPVPINPYNFRKYRLGLFTVSIAGVLMNYLMAFLAYPLYVVCYNYLPDMMLFDEVITLSVGYIWVLSLNFCVFNLLPFYPLDGFRIVDALNRKRGPIYRFLHRYGQYVLLSLVLLSIVADFTGFYYIDLLGWFMRFATDIVGWPITAVWNTIF